MSDLEYKVLLKILAEQQKTNDLLQEQNELIKGGVQNVPKKQSEPTDTRKSVKNNNSTRNKRGLPKP